MTGSRTGILLIPVAAAGALLIFAISRNASRSLTPLWIVAVIAAIAVVGFGIVLLALSESTAVGRVAARFAMGEDARAENWKDTWFALKQFWPAGFGMGGFEPAMLPVERLEVLAPAIPNRAHNDFLEIGLEAGILGYAMVAGAAILCMVTAWRGWRAVPGMRRQIVFGLFVLIVIALHSVVDYPLRSMAVATLAGVAGGMLVKNRASAHREVTPGTSEEVKGLA
jgi:O-antigen ligase